ncbi:MAG: inositol monophosphatase [Propionibacteriaceae bacterium]|nr:inositol monophosphatase [Propionibacteriaceae bacterium]
MDTAAILDLIKETAATIITPRFRTLRDEDIAAKSEPGDLVTVADREAEAFLTDALSKAFPGALVVGEEATFTDPGLLSRLPSAAQAFVIDPIDGTRNFVRGRIEHGVMLAEVRHGRATRGWIWQPQTGRAYVVEQGAGVRLNDAPVETRRPERLPLGATSKERLHDFTGDGALSPVVSTRFACAYDYPRLLHGELDFLHYTKVCPWDHLAGCLMVTEHGGCCRTLDGVDYRAATTYPGLIAAYSPDAWQQVATVWPVTPAADSSAP